MADRKRWSAEDVHQRIDEIAPEFADQAAACARVYAEALAASLGADLGYPEVWRSSRWLGTYEVGFSLVAGERTFNVLIGFLVDDELEPYAMPAGFIGRGEEERLIECTADAEPRSRRLWDPDIGEWLAGRFEALTRSAQHVVELAAPILVALEPESTGMGLANFIVGEEAGKVVLRLPEP